MKAESNVPQAEAGGTLSRIWRCPACNRLLIEKSIDYARQRHAQLASRTTEPAGPGKLVLDAPVGETDVLVKGCGQILQPHAGLLHDSPYPHPHDDYYTNICS